VDKGDSRAALDFARVGRTLLSVAFDLGFESVESPPWFRDMAQISRGKLDRLRCTTAGFTTSELDRYGLRNHWLARPPP